MLKKRKSGFTLLGYPLSLVLLVLFIITYLMLKSQKRKTIQARIIDTLVNNGINPITATFVFCQAAHETGNFTSPFVF